MRPTQQRRTSVVGNLIRGALIGVVEPFQVSPGARLRLWSVSIKSSSSQRPRLSAGGLPWYAAVAKKLGSTGAISHGGC